MTTKTARAQSLMYEIAKHYQDGIHTWGHCQACSEPARGGGLCASCLTDDLGGIVGQGAADAYLASVVELARARRVVCNLAEGK
jgi:hypothetical protein